MVVSKLAPEPGNKWGKTRIVARPKQTPLASSKEEIDNILNSVPSSDSFTKTRTYEDLKSMVDNWINDTNKVDESKLDNSVGVQQYSAPESKSVEKVTPSDMSDLDTALEDLMG